MRGQTCGADCERGAPPRRRILRRGHAHIYLTGVGLPPSVAAGRSKAILSEA